MKIKELMETATAGSSSSAHVGAIPNPHISPGKARGKKSYTGSPGQSGKKSPAQPKPANMTGKNALDMKTSLFGENKFIKR
jgi:hypothetical protein